MGDNGGGPLQDTWVREWPRNADVGDAQGGQPPAAAARAGRGDCRQSEAQSGES